MNSARPQFSIDDAFELSLEDAGPGPESSGVARFGPLHFERRARFEVADEDKQSRPRYQVTGLVRPSSPPARFRAGPHARPWRTSTRENLSVGPSLNGRPSPDVASGPEPFPDPLSSDFGPQPPLESPEPEPGSSSPTPRWRSHLESSPILGTDFPPSAGLGSPSIPEPDLAHTLELPPEPQAR